MLKYCPFKSTSTVCRTTCALNYEGICSFAILAANSNNAATKKSISDLGIDVKEATELILDEIRRTKNDK